MARSTTNRCTVCDIDAKSDYIFFYKLKNARTQSLTHIRHTHTRHTHSSSATQESWGAQTGHQAQHIATNPVHTFIDT